MKKSIRTSKAVVLAVLAVALVLSIFAIATFAADASGNVWTFTSGSVKDPLYVQNHFTELPRAYEAEVNFPEGSYGSSSPIIANWANSDTRDSFGFQIGSDGKPAMYYYQTYYDAATSTTKTDNNIMVKFNYSVIGKGWVRIAVSCETDSESSVYKLFVNGVLEDTVTHYPYVHTIDPVFSQDCTRELSIGNDGKNHFKGQLRNVAVYKDPLTEAEAANTAKANMQANDANLMAYYDATMSGNTADFIKDQTGNGHNAAKAFIVRKNALDSYDYSFAFIGDTQFLVEQDVNKSSTQYAGPIYDWIVANKDSKKIARVFGLGDITDDNNEAQWNYAKALHQKLVNNGVSFSIIPGNHDDYTTPAANYNNYFKELAGFVQDGSGYGYYKDTRLENFYTKFEVGENNEYKYMVIGIQYGAPDDILEWANGVVAANPDRQVIVITHSLFNSKGEWAMEDTTYQTTTSRKYLNNGIDLWNKFISQHSNIIIAAAGHISSDTIKHGQSVGVNGNVVNTFLINPQGFDKATNYDTGMVAMFYFSDGGKKVQVEYVSTTKTLRAQEAGTTTSDILYHERDSFTFSVNELGTGITETAYGDIPNASIVGNVFAVFEGGAFVSAHPTWNSVTTKVAEMFTENPNRNLQLLMLKDYENADDALATNAFNYANGSLTIDLGRHTFVRSDTFLNFNNYGDITNVASANIILKNGTVRSKSGTIIDTQIKNNGNYTKEKTWNLTVENVTLGYAVSTAAPSGVFYQAWPNNASSEYNYGATTNITFNNCTFDLKTNAPDTMILFNLSDAPNMIDVHISINGGKMLADKATDLNGVTFYSLDSGDSVIFGAYNGAYTQLHTPTPTAPEEPEENPIDHTYFGGAFPAADGNRYFVKMNNSVQIAQAGDKGLVYELKSLVYNLGEGSVSGSASVENISAIEYPFFVFNKNGKFEGAFKNLLDPVSGAMHAAITTALAEGSDTAYIFMRRDYTLDSAEVYEDFAYANGTVVLDLGGYSLIADKSRSTYIFHSDAKAGADGKEITYPSYFLIQNGSIRTYNAPVIQFFSHNKSVSVDQKLMSWTFDDVTFGLVKDSKYDRFFHIKNSTKGSTVAPVELNFNDCVFDLETVQPNPTNGNFYIFRSNFTDGTDIKADIRINGGEILASSLSYSVDSVAKYVCLDNFSVAEKSTMYFGKGSDGEYIKIILPESATFTIGIEETDVTGTPITKYNLQNKLVKKNESGVELVLDLASKGKKYVYTFTASSSTPYGDIPADSANSDTYPFLVFDASGKCYPATSFLGSDGAVAKAVTVLNSDTSNVLANGKYSGTVYVLARRDYTLTSSETYGDWGSAMGNVVIDLANHSIIADSLRTQNKYIFDSDAKTGIKYPSYITIKDGSIRTCKSYIFRFNAGNTAENLISWTLEGVTLGLVEGSTLDRFFNVSVPSGVSNNVPLELNFNDCIFDLKTVAPGASSFYVLRTNFIETTYLKADVKINGGEIRAQDPANSDKKIFLDNFTDQTGSTMCFGAGKDGEFLKIAITAGNTFGIYTYDPVGKVESLYNLENNITKKTASGTDIKFYKAESTAAEDIYTFCFDTKYGTVPAKYEDTEAYPFFVFNSSGFEVATNLWGKDEVTSALNDSKSTGSVVLLRRNFSTNAAQYNNLSQTHSVTIDLGGFELKTTNATFFMAQKKTNNNTTVTVKNGTLLNAGKRAIIKMDTSDGYKSNEYGFNFVFEEVTFKLPKNNQMATTSFICFNEFKDADYPMFCNLTFDNCIFDLSEADKEFTLFDVSYSQCKVTAVINGGEIKTPDAGVTLWKDYKTDPDTVTANAESSLTFGKLDGGSYTVLTVPKNTAAPFSIVNDGALIFVRTAKGDTSDTYSLVSAEVIGSFTPKSSITLYTDFVYNIYVPKNNVTAISINGTEKELAELAVDKLSDGKDYYKLTVNLSSYNALLDITLSVTVKDGETSFTGGFTFSTFKYALSIVDGEYSTVEKALAKDMLSYVSAAYDMWNKTSDKLASIDTLLGEDYDASNAPDMNKEIKTPGISEFKAVTFYLGEAPAYRFYYSGTTAPSYTFKVGSRVVDTTLGSDNEGNYVEVKVYAYELLKGISFTDGTNTYEYNVYSYYSQATDASVKHLVERLVKYCESANAYRDSIVSAN